MSDDVPWMDKATFMREQSRSERTIQQWVTDGKADRQIIDGKAYYRIAPQHPAAPLHPAAPPWAVELLTEIRALRSEIAAQKALPPPAEPRSEVQHRSTPLRPWWKRLFIPE